MPISDFSVLVKKIRNTAKVPYEGKGEFYDVGESHAVNGEIHSLKTYQHEILKEGQYEVVQIWNICEECGKTMNSKLVAFDNGNNEYYAKYFIRHGESAKTAFLKSFAVPLIEGGEKK